MQTLNYTITDPMGVHARPAGIFVKAAAKFPCAIKIKKGNNEVDAKRIIAVIDSRLNRVRKLRLQQTANLKKTPSKHLEIFLKENL